VPPGRYSLYTMPYEERWIVALNRSTFHWGNDFSDPVRAREIGRSVAPVDSSAAFVEQLTIDLEPTAGETADLVISWGYVRVAVPVSVAPTGRARPR